MPSGMWLAGPRSNVELSIPLTVKTLTIANRSLKAAVTVRQIGESNLLIRIVATKEPVEALSLRNAEILDAV